MNPMHEFCEGVALRTAARAPYFFNKNEDNIMSLARGFLAELLGISIYIILACGSVPAVEATLGSLAINPSALLVISLSFGVGISIPSYMFADISGANFNPVISFSYWLLKRQSFLRFFIYTFAQLIGSVFATCLLKFVITNAQENVSALGATNISPGIDWIKAVFIEGILSTILVFCMVGVTIQPFGRTINHRDRWNYIGASANTELVVGMTVFALNIIGIPLTGASMNPARSFGPALVSGDWHDHGAYWLGPFVGAFIGVLLSFLFLFRPEGHIFPYAEVDDFTHSSDNSSE